MRNNTDEKLYRQIVETSMEANYYSTRWEIQVYKPCRSSLLRAASSEEVIGKPVFDFVPEEYRELTLRHAKSILDENKPTGIIEK